MNQMSCDLLPRPAVNLARRMTQLAADGDGLYFMQLAFIHGEWRLVINNGKMENLGTIDQTEKIMVR